MSQDMNETLAQLLANQNAMMARLEAADKRNAELAAQLEAAKRAPIARRRGEVSRWVVKGAELKHFAARGGVESGKPFSLVLQARKEYLDGTPVTNASGGEVMINNGNGLYAEWVECIVRTIKENPELLEDFASLELIEAQENDTDMQKAAREASAARNARKAARDEARKSDGAAHGFRQYSRRYR